MPEDGLVDGMARVGPRVTNPRTSADTAPAILSAAHPHREGHPLRNLYYVRFVFALVWAILLVLTAHTINPFAVVLLIIYPVFDVAAAVIDFRSSSSRRTRAPLYINMVLSLLTAIGLAAAVGSGIPNVLRV